MAVSRDSTVDTVNTDTDDSPTPEAGVRFAEIAPLMDLADMMAPVAVRTAATLRLADHIAAGVDRLPELASATGANDDALRRLLRFLTARGVFSEPEPGVYGLTDMARLLLDDHPARLRLRFDLNGPVGRGDLSFIHLLDSVRTGGPSFERMYGRTFWEDLNASPERVDQFARMMAANIAHSGIEREYDWSDVTSVVDVGGGNATLISQVLAAHPHIHGTVVELGATARQARRTLADNGLTERCEVVEGSFFDPLPAGADAYLLCKILHDWDDAEAVAILRRCARAAGTGGRVLIQEMVLTGDEDALRFSYLDLHMLVYFGGRERTLAEYRTLAEAAGMRLRRVGDGQWGASLLECTVR